MRLRDPAHLAATRRARGLTRAELANRAGLTYRRIHQLETYVDERVLRVTAEAVARALDVDVELLFADETDDA